MTQEAILTKTRNENLNYYDDNKVRGVYKKLQNESNEALNSQEKV